MPPASFPAFAAALRRELSQLNLRWAIVGGFAHEVSLGRVPAVLYCEDDAGRHGNFLAPAYRCIRQTPAWTKRLGKVHTSARRALLSRDTNRRELDSSNSSDALLMNIFCHPETLAAPGLRLLLGIDTTTAPVFGFRPRTPLRNSRRDCTEVDLALGDLLVEAKLTEHNFQTAPRRMIERYAALEEVFDLDLLDIIEDQTPSYQLIRGVLAAHAVPERRFCVLCDARRPDLVAAWHRVMLAVKPADLRCRLQLLTWQELAAVLPVKLRSFLCEKYGILPG